MFGPLMKVGGLFSFLLLNLGKAPCFFLLPLLLPSLTVCFLPLLAADEVLERCK